MGWKLVPITLVLFVIAAVAAVAIGSALTTRNHRQLARSLLDRAAEPARDLDPASLEALPEPVAAYLRMAFAGTDARPVTARLEQTGTMAMNGGWRPFRAVQHVSADPPGFVWDARMPMAPGLAVQVVDAYQDGKGRLRARLAGLVTVAAAGPDPATDAGELMRWLAETPWLPSALLPGSGVRWEAIDARSARATLTHDGTTVALVFRFDERHEIVEVEGLRDRLEDGTRRPWIGRFRNWQEQGGIRIPLEGEVGWVTETGYEPYWRGRIETIVFDPAG